MALPQAADIQTSHYDAGADNPRLARAQLKTLLDKTRDLINAIDTAGGLAKLDAGGKVKLDDLFVTDPTLRLMELYSGVRRMLLHREDSIPEGWLGSEQYFRYPGGPGTTSDRARRNSFRLVQRDAQGHATSCEVGATIGRLYPATHPAIQIRPRPGGGPEISLIGALSQVGLGRVASNLGRYGGRHVLYVRSLAV